jgi:hypothetical protein
MFNPPAMNEAQLQEKNWSLIEKVSFRFIFVFFLLFIIVENNGAFPFFDLIMTLPNEGLHLIIVWAGKNILRLPYEIKYFTYGSGDTTYDYVLLLSCAVTAILSTIVWSLLDRKSVGYTKLYYWLTVIVRFYVGLMLISYGLVKVFKLQFPSPYLSRLMQPYGDSSPMGLAWTFLGFSKGYNYFMGLAELAAGLLLFRRTMTFGALITLVTTANVMAVNYFYDVPVKIVSTALFILTLFLLSRDLQRIALFFFSGEAVSLPVINNPYSKNKIIKITRIALKIIVIGYVVIFGSIESYNSLKEYGDDTPKPKMYGIYNIDKFIYKNDTVPPLTTHDIRWKKLAINSATGARIYHMNDSVSRCFLSMDTIKKTLILKWAGDTTKQYSFGYHQSDLMNFTFKGKLMSDSLTIYLTKVKSKPEDFLLKARGFHWINETPFNR